MFVCLLLMLLKHTLLLLFGGQGTSSSPNGGSKEDVLFVQRSVNTSQILSSIVGKSRASTYSEHLQEEVEISSNRMNETI